MPNALAWMAYPLCHAMRRAHAHTSKRCHEKGHRLFYFKKESLLCFHGKSRPCPGLPLIWSTRSFSRFTPLSHPVIHPCLKSSCHCHLPHSASCSVADGDWLTQQLCHTSRGKTESNISEGYAKGGCA